MEEVSGISNGSLSLSKLPNDLKSSTCLESLEFDDVEVRETNFHRDIMFPMQILTTVNLKYQLPLDIVEFKNTHHFADGSNSKIHTAKFRGEMVKYK